MRNVQKQQGLTLISWIFVLAILSFCGMFAFRVVPMYAENTYVVTALKALDEPGVSLAEMSDAEIKKKLNTFYMTNNVRSEGPQNIVIDRKGQHFTVKIDYENRTNLFYNIDIVTTFENHLDSEHPNLCCKPVESKSATSSY